MRNALVIVGIGATVLLVGGYFASQLGRQSPEEGSTMRDMENTFTLTSAAFENGGEIPATYTCDDKNISPPLSWGRVPEGTKSLAFIMDDPDAPSGTWDHWVMFNIPPSVSGIEEGREPKGVSGKSSFGRGGYGGPCPPSGVHRYFFHFYALDAELDLPEGASKTEILAATEGHILAQAELMGKYERQ